MSPRYVAGSKMATNEIRTHSPDNQKHKIKSMLRQFLTLDGHLLG